MNLCLCLIGIEIGGVYELLDEGLAHHLGHHTNRRDIVQERLTSALELQWNRDKEIKSFKSVSYII